MYFYKNENGQVILTNVDAGNNSASLGKKYKEVFYQEPDFKTIDTNKKTLPRNASTVINRNNSTVNAESFNRYNEQSSVKKGYVKQTNNTTKRNNISKYYTPIEYDDITKKYFIYNKNIKEISYLESNINKSEADFKDFQSKGFGLLGTSIFIDRKIDKSEFLSQAHKLGASAVVVYSKGISEVQYSGYDDPNDLDHIYSYIADFYVKSNHKNDKDTIGISFSSIPLDKRASLQRNTGAYVYNVIEGTRAYRANVIIGDAIIAVNDTEIIDANEFNDIKNRELKRNKVLNLTIVRNVNNELKTIVIPINF